MKIPFRTCCASVLGLAATAGCVAPVGRAEDVAAEPQELAAGSTYTLQGVQSGRCLDIPGDSGEDDTVLQLWDCNGGTNQQFRFDAAGSGYYTIHAVGSGKCLDVQGASTTDGASIVQYACTGGANQQWAVTDLGNASARMTSRSSAKVLDAYGNGTQDGTKIVQWPANGGANQQFMLLLVGNGSSGGGVAPVNPNATTQAKNLLRYIYSQYGNHILSGQQESTWIAGPEYEMSYVHDNTGRYPVVRGLDLGQPSGVADRAISWWNAGGIPLIGYHMGAPTHPDTYAGTMMPVSIDAVLTPGTAEYQSFIQRLDGAAAELQKLKNANAAVLWRPFHEAGGTWFWWSKEGGSQYVRLWKFIFHYFIQNKNLTNLVWVLPYDGSPDGSFYPGKAYVDIAGADTYASDHGPQTALFDATRNIAGTSIPIALHENGPIPDPDQMQSQGARWVLFNTWNDTFLTQKNPISVLKSVYNHSYVVTRDEVPNLK